MACRRAPALAHARTHGAQALYERLLRGGRAAAARAFPAWEWMGDARGGAKRADPKGGALNHAWVPTENT